MNTNRLETKDRTVSIVLSTIITIVLLFFSIFILKWYPPNPPLSDTGVVLNFGVDDSGFGELQPELPDATVMQTQDAQNPELANQDNQMLTGTDEQSQFEAPEQTDTASSILDNQPKEPNNQTSQTQPNPQIQQESLNKPNNSSKPNLTNSSSLVQNSKSTNSENNHGDRPGTNGDQGSPTGSLEAKALYGSAGSGNTPGGSGGDSGGSSLDMAGWHWDERPAPTDQSSEEGRIVFEIQIDETGEIIKISTKERTVSPAVEKIYRREVEKLTFSRTETKNSSAAVSVGRITFVIKSK